MFSSLFVDFNNWTYKEEGFKLLKKYQRKFSKILDNYYGLDIDGKKDKRLAFERYCDTYGLKYGSSKEAKKSKLEIRKLANQALEFVNSKIWVISPTETEEVLDQVLWAEFYAMISKDNLYLRKCESCYKYYLGSPNSKYCKGESKVNYFKDEDGNNFILEMSQCAVVTTMNNYNNMKKSNSIVEVYYNEKRRLEHCLDHFQCNVEEIYIYNLFDVLKKTREANEDNYVKKYKADESIDNRRMLIEEYRKLLIDAVNDELKRVSPEQYKTRNFDRMRYKDTNKDK